jgi:hypothetical protein
VLTNPSVMSLAAEDPALWAELTKAIGGTSAEFATPAAKRARSEGRGEGVAAVCKTCSCVVAAAAPPPSPGAPAAAV